MTALQFGVLIRELRRFFATLGIPNKLVSDNRPAFMAQATEEILRKSRVAHVTIAPYHFATNAQAGNIVYQLKQVLKGSAAEDVEGRLARFLLKQHTTVSTMTEITPAMLMLGRELSTTLTHAHLCFFYLYLMGPYGHYIRVGTQ